MEWNKIKTFLLIQSMKLHHFFNKHCTNVSRNYAYFGAKICKNTSQSSFGCKNKAMTKDPASCIF